MWNFLTVPGGSRKFAKFEIFVFKTKWKLYTVNEIFDILILFEYVRVQETNINLQSTLSGTKFYYFEQDIDSKLLQSICNE